MAKELLLNALVGVLGDYIEGITKENLKVGVWSGKIELKHLQLNRTGIEKLKLPVSVGNGFVNSLKVSIPWTSLASQPVKIFIDGVYLLLGPLDFSNFNSQEALERANALKQARLLQAEKSIELAASLTEQNDPKETTYLQNLTTKIIDNIEIKISNIHIRYEDRQTFPGKTFSFGMTLQSFSVTTTNSKWEETFVARPENETGPKSTYKRAKIENCVVYWNVNSQEFFPLSFEQWMSQMQSSIYKTAEPVDSLQYLIAPPNSLEIKLIHHDKEGHVPRLEAKIQSTNIGLSVNKPQYHQIMRSMDVYYTATIKQQLLRFRPSRRPVDALTSRQWWRYALVLLTNNETILQRKTEIIRACGRHRRRYIDLMKKKNIISPVSGNIEPLTEAEEDEVNFIEQHLPVDALILFRQLAKKNAIVVNRQFKKEEEKKMVEAKKSSWFGGWGKGKKVDPVASPSHSSVQDGDVSIAQLQSDLENAISSSLTDPAAFTVDVSFQSSTTLTIWNETNKITTISMACSAIAELRPERMKANMALTDLSVTDDFTPNPIIPNLVSVIKNDTEEKGEVQQPFSAEFINHDGKITISMKASRLEMCLNKYCIQQLLSILEIPPSTTSSSILILQETQRSFQARASVKRVHTPKSKVGRRPSTTALSVMGAPDLIRGVEFEQTEVKSTLDITFQADAPKIIIPENSCCDIGYLLLDAGHLTIDGKMGPAGMSWEVKFESINAAMPLNLDGVIGNSKPVYLIRPFDVSVNAQDVDKSKADMTVKMDVTTISGELDPSKLSRLLYLSETLSTIFEAPTLTFPTDSTLDVPDSRVVNPFRNQMNIVVSLPSINLDLQYGMDHLQRNIFSIYNLKADVTTRVYDMYASFQLEGLSVQDNIRSERQKYLASTPLSGEENLISIQLKKLSNRRSPFFQESENFGTIVEVNFGTLVVNTDARNILHLRPLYEVLMGKRLTNYPPELTYDVLLRKAGGSQTLPEVVLPIPRGGVSGTYLKLSLNTISLELLRADLSPSTGKIVQLEELESVFILDIQDLAAEIKSQTLTEAVCRMKSLRIRDTRALSEEYYFKTIFGPAVQINSLTRNETDPIADSSNMTLVEAKLVDEPIDLLSVKFHQISENDSQVDIKIGHIDSFVSLDTITDLIAIASSNALAVVELTASVEDTRPVEPQLSTSQTQLASPPPQSSTNSMSVCMNMMSSRLILLDDPTTLSSRALSARCSIDVRYQREESFNGSVVEEDVCLMVNEVETFVALDMRLDQPHQIMDPTGLTLNLKRSIDHLITTKTSISLNIDGLATRLSLNDILLAISILQRRTIVEAAPASVETLLGDDEMAHTHRARRHSLSGGEEIIEIVRKNTVDELMEKDPLKDIQHLTAYTILLNVGTLSTVILNNYDGQDTPLFRLEFVSTSFSAEGFIQDIQGQGSMIMRADFYNSHVSEWEPVIDRWCPDLTLNGDISNFKLGIVSTSTLQFSITSSLLQTISQTYSLLQTVEEGTQREMRPNLTIHNKLGLPVVVDNALTGEILFHLENGQIIDVFLAHRTSGPLLVDVPGRTREIISHLPSKIDLRVPISPDSDAQIIRGISMNANKKIRYQIKTTDQEPVQTGNSKPEVEIIYEFQRYRPLGGGWKEPFMMGDPPQWCNRQGKKCPLNAVSLPSTSWEWIDNWKVDLDPKKIGKKTDAEGWEYGINFSSLNSESRGAAQPIDYARRRKWIRSRIIRSNQDNAQISSLALFCEFNQLDDGSRELALKSSIEVVNYLPFDILLCLTRDSIEIEFGPIPSNQTFSIPLIYSTFTGMKIKHAVIPCNWSDNTIPLLLNPDDYTNQSEVYFVELTENRHIYSRVITKQYQKFLTVSLYPNLIVTNLVPSKISYKFAIGGDNKGRNIEIVEEGVLEAGSQTKLNHLKLSHFVYASLQIGNMEWSDFSVPLFQPRKNSQRLNIYFRKENGLVGFILRLRVNQSMNGPYEVIIFSKDALIDYTGLGLSVDALIEKGESDRIIRTGGGRYELAAQSKQIVGRLEPFHIHQFKVKSKRKYTLGTVNVNSLVHTDRKYRFLYLPEFLREQTYISTPSDDRDIRVDGGHMIQFTLHDPAYIILLFDKRVNILPPWVENFGFRRTVEHVVATGYHDGFFHEIHYAVFGKLYKAGEKVGLGSNHSRDCRGMYSVFILSESSSLKQIIGNQILFEPEQFALSAETCWWNGGCGLTLFNSETGRVKVGLDDGRGWVEKEISLKILSTDKGTFEIIDSSSHGSYQLAYTVKPMAGQFKRTKILSIIPRYAIVNCLDEDILIQQKGVKSSEPLTVEPFTTKGWHKSDHSKSTEIFFRYGSSVWSLASIDISEVGTHSIFMPIVSSDSETRTDYAIVNVEVKLAGNNDFCAVSIIFWKSLSGNSNTPTPLSIRNNSDRNILLRQNGISSPLYQITVPAKGWLPFGWANSDLPNNQRLVAITSDDSFDNPHRTILISFSNGRGKIHPLPFGRSYGASDGNLLVTVETHMNGIVLFINSPLDEPKIALPTQTNESISRGISTYFTFELQSIGLSLIADLPKRRELISLYAEGLNATYISHPSTSEETYQVSIMDVQIDNYSETAIYPVLLRRVDERRKSPATIKSQNSTDDTPNKLPFIEFAMVQQIIPGTPPCTTYEYISMRILEFALEIDSGTIQMFLNDFWCDLKLLSRDELLACSHPTRWVTLFNGTLLSPTQRQTLLDVHKAHMDARVSRMFFKELVIHPMKMALTFMQTDYQSEKDEDTSLISSTVLDIISSMATVELMEIKLKSFIVTEAVESFATLQSRIQSKLYQDLIGQLATIAGSLTLIGSPAGLVRNIGNGVQDFFYEPYLGLVQSPEDFFLGLKRGTGSLIAGVVGGTLNSAAAIVGTASSGFAYLSGDAEFVRQRSKNRQKSDADRDRGLIGGLKAGGKEVVAGFASGVTGIFTKPVEEAQKDGALGFIKGLGMGVAGVAVKPVLGIADGLTTIAQGISNEVADTASFRHVRPPRAFGRSSADPSVLILVPVQKAACSAQDYVHRHAKKKNMVDEYISSFTIDDNSRIILSDHFVFWIQPQGNLWRKSWGEISHVTLEENSIAIYLYEDLSMRRPPPIVPCKTKKNAEKVYELFYSNVHLLGNPAVMVSLDELTDRGDSGKTSSDYVFGSCALSSIQRYQKMTGEEIIVAARDALSHISDNSTLSIHDLYKKVDQILTTLIFQWNANHRGRNICCAAILNETTVPLQFSKFRLTRGKNVKIFGSQEYDKTSQTLGSRGCLILFATANPRTLNDSGNVLIEISSPSFNAVVGTRLQKAFCKGDPSSGMSCSFLEKSSSDNAAKFVISVI